MAAPTTYPGSLVPLRGLAPFGEADRDGFFGRDDDRDALAKLITQDGARAGLLVGEPGVGKTSLIRAGLAPHLRDHGFVAVVCEDIHQPTQSFATALEAMTRVASKEGEKPVDYLTRVIGQALTGQVFVFLLDDVDQALRHDTDGRLAHELGDLFARVATRSAGRARFLFACADLRMHLLDALERRTGSLFPPPSRFRLPRFTVEKAQDVLDKTLALAAVPSSPEVSKAAAEELARVGPILPAELQLVARMIQELRITSPADLARAGGAPALVGRWIDASAEAAGDKRSALRLLAELAAEGDVPPLSAHGAAMRAGLDPGVAQKILPALAQRGVLATTTATDPYNGEAGVTHFVLAHEMLAPRLRDLALPASDAARKARDTLATATEQRGRLTIRELMEVQSRGVVPGSDREVAAIRATKRRFVVIAAAAVITPLALLAATLFLNAGRYHLGTARLGGDERVVARSGRPILRPFFWLGGFGDVAVDVGFARALVAPDRREGLADRDHAGALAATDGTRPQYLAQALSLLRPEIRALILYAATGDEAALGELERAKDGGVSVDVLELLAPIATGAAGESRLVGAALSSPSPAIQRAALDAIVAAARRRPGAFRDVLARGLAEKDEARRRQALTAARAIGGEEEAAALAAALRLDPPPAIQAELLQAVLAKAQGAGGATAAAAAGGILGAKGVDAPTLAQAWEMIDGALASDPVAGVTALATLAADGKAAPAARVRALRRLEDVDAPKGTTKAIAAAVEAAAKADDGEVRAAALPLLARQSPDAALAALGTTADPAKEVRAAQAIAWGELVASHRAEAEAALAPLLVDKVPAVRAAALRAWGRAGKDAQELLVKLAKDGGNEVSEGAAWGLAASVEAGGSIGSAYAGLAPMWKAKGARRRTAAQVYGRLARKNPQVFVYVASAARTKEDPLLRQVAVDTICPLLDDKKLAANAATVLRDAAGDEQADVRRRVAVCLRGRPSGDDALARVAPRLATDADPAIRADAARALAGAAGSKNGKGAGAALVALLADDDAGVRAAAARGLAALGKDAPEGADDALRTAWARASDPEKLALLGAAQAVGAPRLIEGGSSDPSPDVRARTLAAAVALKLPTASFLGPGLADPDPRVRREALRLVADPASQLPPQAAIDTLELGARDADPLVRAAALEALVGLEEPAGAEVRLGALLESPSEGVRALAASAGRGLAARDPKRAQKLLEPALRDAAHDVRVAATAAMGEALASSEAPAKLVERLRDSETDAPRRLAAAAALLALARRSPTGAEEITAALAPLAKDGPPMARFTATLVTGLLAANADGAGFLARLVP